MFLLSLKWISQGKKEMCILFTDMLTINILQPVDRYVQYKKEVHIIYVCFLQN